MCLIVILYYGTSQRQVECHTRVTHVELSVHMHKTLVFKCKLVYTHVQLARVLMNNEHVEVFQ